MHAYIHVHLIRPRVSRYACLHTTTMHASRTFFTRSYNSIPTRHAHTPARKYCTLLVRARMVRLVKGWITAYSFPSLQRVSSSYPCPAPSRAANTLWTSGVSRPTKEERKWSLAMCRVCTVGNVCVMFCLCRPDRPYSTQTVRCIDLGYVCIEYSRKSFDSRALHAKV